MKGNFIVEQKEKKIVVLVPCYNEETTIEKVVKSFKKNLQEAIIYVFDNNSTDKTAEIAKKAGAIVCFEKKQGKGNVIRSMFENIEADCYILVDGDDTYDAESARKISDLVLKDKIDMVICDRLSSDYFAENKRAFHNFGNRLVRYSINKIFNSDIKDILTGYRAFSRRFVKTFPITSKNFEIETEMTIHAIFTDMKIKNIKTRYKDRPANSVSKLNTFKDGFKVIKTIINLFKNYKPLKFFSYLSLFLILIAAIFFFPSCLIPYIKTGVVEKIPTLIACGFIMMAALMSFFSGLILDSIMQKEKREFRLKILKETKTFKD